MSRIYTTDEVVKLFKEVHGDLYTYDNYVYPKRKELKGLVTCKEHGDFETSRMHHMKGSGCPVCKGVPRGGWKTKGREKFLEELEASYSKFNDYDFSKFEYKNSTTKSTVICPKHGEFQITPKALLQHNHGCSACSGKRKLTLEGIQQRLDEIHGEGKYRVTSDDYINNKTRINVECSVEGHGSWDIRPDNLLNSEQRCPKCANTKSKMELELLEFVQELDENVISGSKDIIEPLELDVYSEKHQLALEFNGLYYHSEDMKKKYGKNYHLHKTTQCLDLGIRLLHIFEDEWLTKKDIWHSMIRYRFGKVEKKHYARKCDIREVDIFDASKFLTENHLQGYCKSSIRLGLYMNNELVSILTMGKSRFDHNIEWEICRYANKLNTSTIGGFNRLLKHFIKTQNPKSIVTYADRRYSEGDLYRNFGMVQCEDTPISYSYFDKHKLVRLSRHQCQKHKLEKLLPNFDPTLTEKDNMLLHGYNIIWDCGSKKFIWSNLPHP